LLLSLAYPDRVARTRSASGTRYQLANGRGALLPEGDALSASDWIVAAHLDGANADGRIFLAAPLDVRDVAARAAWHDVLAWDTRAGALAARRERSIGAIVLEHKPLPHIPPEQRARVLCEALRDEGLDVLDWTDEGRQWQARVLSLRIWNGDDWPDLSDSALRETLAQWLPPWLDGVSRREHFKRLDVQQMLAQQLPPRQQQALAALAPTHLEVPSGSRIRLTYAPDGAAPVLAVKLQEMFGLADTPTVNNGRQRVLCHLLSPAQRPLQVTQDLRSFWANTYPQIRKELRARYIKHPWPEDPWTAEPTRRTNRR
jgi:ATP-dependent helicase HrpB